MTKATTQRTVTHASFTIERSYSKPPERVFAAFSDPAKKRRWFAEGEGFEIQKFEMDFRVGGREHCSFRVTADSPVKGASMSNETVYQDIVPNQRIVLAYTMNNGGKPFSASLATIELLPDGGGTHVVFTEQAAFFENADGPKIREQGWNELLKRLEKEIMS